MTIYEAVGYYMINSTEIQDYTDNIFHGDIPEGTTATDTINYFMVSRPNVAFGAAERPRFQVSCRSNNPGTVMNMANAVKSVFTEVQNSVGTSFDFQNTHFEAATFISEPETGLYHVHVDVFVTYTNY